MLNLKILFLTLTISFSLLGLVKVKVYVQDLREEITDMEKSKSQMGDEIQVLKAEWSNLNRLERIRNLSDKYLKLKSVSTKSLKNLEEYTAQDSLRFTNVKNQSAIPQVSWRYKPREVILKAAKER